VISHLLDTDICIDLLRRRRMKLFERLQAHEPEQIAISAITLAELCYGAARSARPQHHADLIARFCAPLGILPFDEAAAQAYAGTRAELERRGKPIGPLDTLIAAHALSRGLTLVTQNQRGFQRVPGLTIAAWR